MVGKQRVDMTQMYRALTELGHRRIWLRIINSGVLFMVTFDSRPLARLDRGLGSWGLLKYADLVDDYPVGRVPAGGELTELHEKDDGELLFNLTIREDDVDRLRSYLATLDG